MRAQPQPQQPQIGDEHLIRREIYNPNAFEIVFRLDSRMKRYVHESGITLGPETVTCKPDGFCILNHGYYVPWTRSGEGGTFITNFGDDIGRGNKMPSRPVIERRRLT